MIEDSVPPRGDEPADEPAPEPAPDRLTRPQEGRMFLGVCAGIGRRVGVDPIVLRVGFGLLLFASGWGLLLYVLAVALTPSADEEAAWLERKMHRRFTGDAVLSILTLVLGLGVLIALPSRSVGNGVTVAVVLALVLLTAQSRGVNLISAARGLPERLQGRPAPPVPPAPPGARFSGMPPGAVDLGRLNSPPGATDTGAPREDVRPYDPIRQDDVPRGAAYGEPYGGAVEVAPRQRGLTGITLLMAAAAGLAVTPLWRGRTPERAWEISLAAALAVVGLGLVVATWYGRRRGLVAAGAVLSVALLTTAAPAGLGLSGGKYGSVEWRPTDAPRGEQTYRLVAGDGRLDLRALPLSPGGRVTVRAELGAGRLRVMVPAGARVEITAQAGLGDVTVDHRVTSGPRARVSQVLLPDGNPPNPPVIALTVRGRLGDVEVLRG